MIKPLFSAVCRLAARWRTDGPQPRHTTGGLFRAAEDLLDVGYLLPPGERWVPLAGRHRQQWAQDPPSWPVLRAAVKIRVAVLAASSGHHVDYLAMAADILRTAREAEERETTGP